MACLATLVVLAYAALSCWLIHVERKERRRARDLVERMESGERYIREDR